MATRAGTMRVGDLRVAMLHYEVGAEHVYVTLIDEDGLRQSTRLTTVEQVAQPVERLAWMLRAPTRFPPSELTKTLRSFSQDWGRRLLPASELLAGYDILVIIPHHFLHDLPLQVVFIGDADECLGNRFGISYCSSATLFERAVSRNPARVGGMAGWRFPLADGLPENAFETPNSCCAAGVDVLGGDLRYAELAKACADRFAKGQVMRSRDQLKSSSAKEADVICLVCHGVTDVRDHDNSGLLLTGRPFGPYTEISLHLGEPFAFRDLPFSYLPPQLELEPQFQAHPLLAQLMTIAEVKMLVETRAQLVMLLGCSTATGELRSGDSYTSLAYQWLQAGAASVLGHQWEADFPFVAGWVSVFLANWIERRQPKAIAVRESLNQVLADGLVSRDALHLWGAVVLLGDWI
ncbi:CHAT domain-containing protein [Streptomyces sp. NPDC049541]|uniref:CHAT domain-containing protein n=1 Tax=Streptomyces sp. NPDC049541 TaxID=3365594 RepID=UPI003788FDFA